MFRSLLIFVFTAVVLTGGSNDKRALPCDIHLTVSTFEEYSGNLELNWKTPCELMPDWIGLFDKDPSVIEDVVHLVKVIPRQVTDGFFITNITMHWTVLPGGWNKTQSDLNLPAVSGPQCLDYWIGSFVNGALNASNCLKIQPTWLADNRAEFSRIPISEMLLPGTHDTGSFYGESLVKGEALKKFIFTQKEDIWNQLVFGIRYLDIRVGYFEEEDQEYIPIYTKKDNDSSQSSEKRKEMDNFYENNFWLNHDLVKIRPLLPILQDIKRFAEKAKDEIIIVDIHRLPVGFYLIDGSVRYKRHHQLINFLFKELGDLAVDFSKIIKRSFLNNAYSVYGPRMADIWETGKRIIICYPEASLTIGSWLWPPLSQKWGNRQTASSLKQYIETVLRFNPPAHGNPLWAIMGQMTPRAIDIIFNPKNDLMKMADSVNRNLTRWLRDEWVEETNIIATDFFMGNNLIDLSVNQLWNGEDVSIPRPLVSTPSTYEEHWIIK